jgi:multifunctional cyclase/dehydratase/O-methyltransferase
MAPPAVRVLEGLFGIFDNRVLGLLVELQIPENLDEPRTSEQLAETTDSSPQALSRILRFAAGRGFIDEGPEGTYRPNEVTRVLRRDHPNSWTGWVEFAASEWHWAAWRHLDATLDRDGVSGMETATGSKFFDYLSANPDASDVFDRAMEAGATMQGLALSSAFDWTGVTSVCDVGGGTGAALRVLLEHHPHLNGTLYDLPSVVAKAQPVAGLEVEGGDFFAAIPKGCDRYLLLAVVHDWDDEEATKILSNLCVAMPWDGRAFVVENVITGRARGDFTESSDLLMLVLGSGRERTQDDYIALFERAGLSLRKAHHLPTGFIAFELGPGG